MFTIILVKILHIIPNITVAFGGPVNSMNNIIEIWLSAGHEVDVLFIERHSKTVPVAGILMCVQPSFPTRLSNSSAAAKWLAQSFSHFDVVFIHSVWSAIGQRSSLFLRRQRRPYVVIPHGSLDPFDVRKKSLLKKFLGPLIVRGCLEGSSAVLCSAQREADCLVTYGATCRKTVLPWPVTPSSSNHDREEARRRFGFKDKEFVVLSLGRIDYKKGFPVLLPAIQRLAQSGITTRLLIVGPDSRGYGAVVRQMVDRLGLREIVTFLSPVLGDEKRRLMKSADCFALPSLHENFGMAIVEAMQQGLPCVISNNVNICSELEQGGAALVCNYDDREVFASLRKLSESSELRARMSAAAVRVAKRFEPEVLKERYLAMLHVLSEPPIVRQ
jgi:glycosyltransferase involved in cell wall biosynthesis